MSTRQKTSCHNFLFPCLFQKGKQEEFIDIATVHFEHLPQEVIEAVAPDVLGCAGSFAIEHDILKHYIKSIDGTQDSVLGLPLEPLIQLIRQTES